LRLYLRFHYYILLQKIPKISNAFASCKNIPEKESGYLVQLFSIVFGQNDEIKVFLVRRFIIRIQYLLIIMGTKYGNKGRFQERRLFMASP